MFIYGAFMVESIFFFFTCFGIRSIAVSVAICIYICGESGNKQIVELEDSNVGNVV